MDDSTGGRHRFADHREYTPSVDERKALAKVSEMQTAISAQQAQFNVGLVDGQLHSLGEAMVPADALEAAGQALHDPEIFRADPAPER